MTETLVRRIAALPTSLRCLIAAGFGGLGALSLAPFHIAPLSLVMLVAGCLLIQTAPSRAAAFGIGWTLGAAYFAVALHWIVEPFQVDAALHGWMAPFALVGMAGGLALFWGFAFWGSVLLGRAPWSLAVLWPLAELGRAYLFTGFPWAAPPQSLVDGLAGQALAFGGPHGLMLAMAFTAALIASPLRGLVWRLGQAALALAAVSAILLPAPARDLNYTDQTLRLIQPNAPQHEKWDPDKIPVFIRRQLDFAAAPGAPDWIVMPETALPYLLEWSQPLFDDFAASAVAPIALGIQRQENGKYFNALVTLDAAGQVAQTYDKHHLVPFGEYMPFPVLFSRLNVGGLAQRVEGAYTPGPGPALIQMEGIGPVLPLVCYEAVFAHDVGGAPGRPELILHLTNDAWFGDFAGPQQHLSQARMRAIEQGLPVARAANTGISAMIGPDGRILQALPLNQAGFLDARLPRPYAATFYAKTGDLPWAMLLIGLTSVAIGRRIWLRNRAPD